MGNCQTSTNDESQSLNNSTTTLSISHFGKNIKIIPTTNDEITNFMNIESTEDHNMEQILNILNDMHNTQERLICERMSHENHLKNNKIKIEKLEELKEIFTRKFKIKKYSDKEIYNELKTLFGENSTNIIIDKVYPEDFDKVKHKLREVQLCYEEWELEKIDVISPGKYNATFIDNKSKNDVTILFI